MDLSKMSVTEMKAAAYDILAGIEQAQKNLQIVNQAIAQKSKQQPPPEPVEVQ